MNTLDRASLSPDRSGLNRLRATLVLLGLTGVSTLGTLALGTSASSSAAAPLRIGDDYQPTHDDSVCVDGDLLGPLWCLPADSDSVHVRVYFNCSLDARLDGAANPGHIKGGDDDRKRVFFQAIADWNAALATVGAYVRLVGDTTYLGPPDFARDLWAGDQADSLCDEQDSTATASGFDVFDRSYANHRADGLTVVSTGHNHGGQNEDPVGLPLDAGWIAHDLLESFSTDLLGECDLRVDADADTCIVEGGILWFTHFLHSNPSCMLISWDYTGPAVPCGLDQLDPHYYDYYSVVLHELGHLLGLDHFRHGDPACHNVMTGQLFARERQKITSKEEACLRRLYAVPAAVGVAETPPAARRFVAKPNPFRRALRIEFDADYGLPARVDVFDPAGRAVRSFGGPTSPVTAGAITWDGADATGRDLPPGVYFVRFEWDRDRVTERVVKLPD
jgi:hypothetical protein